MDSKTTDELNRLAGSLCARLKTWGGRCLPGKFLAAQLGLSGTRALRRLVAHARVNLHRHEIVGVPGEGYLWGPSNPDKVKAIIEQSRRMGRCYFFIGSLLKREGTAMAAVQLVLDFMETADREDPRQADDLATLVAAEGTSVAQFLNAFVKRLGDTPEGRKVLADVGAQHAELLLPEELRTEMVGQLDAVKAKLESLGKKAG